MSYITYPEQKIDVFDSFDVAVVGGGVAGISAALAAARCGAKTLLVEREFALGGLATLGLVTIYLPICDGMGRQVSFGIAEELLRLSVKHGCEINTPWLLGGSLEEKKKTRFRVQYNPSVFAILCEKLLLEAGVTVFYGSQLSDVILNDGGDKISSLILQNKEGLRAVNVGSVVDASGDCDVFYKAGAETREFEQKNLLAYWCYSHKDGKHLLNMYGCADIPDKYKTEEQKNKPVKRYRALTSEEISEFCIDSHSALLKEFLKNGDIHEQHNLSSMASIPQLRMTRKLCGKYEMNDTEMHKRFENSVGLFSDWRKSGPVYELPFDTLICDKLKNVAAAGRCISVTDDMWDITRVIPVCAVSGEAAGVACALSDDFSVLNIKTLQNTLEKSGVKLHE